jgi:perosamine synthetase
MFRLSIPVIGSEEERAVRKVLKSGFLVQGKKVAEFETVVADFLGVKFAVAVNSGTSALHLALIALNIGPGDEVILPDYTFPATINVVELCGAKPVIVDIEPDTFNIDPEKIEKAITAKTKAIMPVHLFGQSADMDPIIRLGRKRKIPVVEDAACVLGATYNGHPCGTLGQMGCFSFHPRKIITTGEGGLIVTNNQRLAERLRLLRNHGMVHGAKGIDFLEAGFNYRMTEMSAAMGLVQMGKLSEIISDRQKVAAQYDRQLKALPWMSSPKVFSKNTHIYQAYIAQVDSSVDRNALLKYLKNQNVEANFGTYALHRLTFYRTKYQLKAKDFPVTESIFNRTLALPFFAGLSKNQIQQIVRILERFHK